MMFWKRLGYLLPWRRRAAERDMQEELRSIAAMADRGELGNLTVAAEDARAEWGWTRLEQTAQDIRYAIRTLAKSPSFTLAAVLSLAIGIGANTALFTVINTLMWKRLPVSDPEHLLTIEQQGQSGTTNAFTYQQYELFRDRGQALDLAAYSLAQLDAGIDGQAEPTLDAQLVTGKYFPLLGLPPALGRLLDEGDDRVPMGHQVAVLSHTYWQRRFAGAPTVLGRTITLGGLPFTVIGVTPAEFFGAEVGTSPSLYLPVMMQPALKPMNGSLLEQPSVLSTWLRLLGRLKPGVPLAQAAPRLNALAGTPETEWRPRNKFTGQFEDARLVVSSAAAGLSELRRQFSRPLFVLLGVAGLVLLIACANVGQLVLARSAARRPEFALRLALGASRGRVTRQVLVEGLVLTGIGAAAGIVLAFWAAPALVQFASAGQGALELDLSPDLRVLAFAVLVSVAAGLLFASAPAIRASRTDVSAQGTRDLGRTRPAGAQVGPGRTLVIVQVALSVVSLVGAGLFVRTLQNLNRHERAIDVERVIVAPLEPRGSGRRTADNALTLDRTYRDLLARIEAIPGVRSASLARTTPLGPSTLGFPVMLPAGGEARRVDGTIVYPRYFATMGLPIVKGRDFTEDDLRTDATPAVLVNEAFVREFLQDREPLGVGHGLRQARGRGPAVPGAPLNVIGVVRDSGLPGRREATPPKVYQTFLQANTGFGQMVLHVRAARDSADIMRPIVAAVQEIARDVPMAPVRTLAAEVDAALVRERLVATLSSLFGCVALALICIGLYGLMAFTVARRTPEIGIRMALGATRSDVRWLVGRDAFAIVLLGLAIGLPAAWIAGRLASRVLSPLLYKVTTTDPITIAVAIGVLLLVTMAAGVLPARRAVRIDPMNALRAE
jgi:putative ABC transport system permease protein